MMRGPQIEDCLQARHLWFDRQATSLPKTDMQAAEQQLKAAREVKDAIEQTNSSYKAMYSAALALVHSIGYKLTGFRPLVTVLEDYFVKKGLLDAVHVQNFLRAQRIEGAPAENVQAAEAFVAAVSARLSEGKR